MTAVAETHAIVRASDYEGMTLAVSPAEAHRRVQELQAFVTKVMVRDEDYGTIPGTDKPTLYQPGAQKLAEIYGLAHRFEVIDGVKDWERGFFYFEYRCIVSSRRDGRHICEGIGSCNSKESKYSDRWVFDRDVPSGMNKSSLKTKEITSRKNGRSYTMYQVPNPDPFSLVNTIQKMAAKRAYVHAIISATRSAGVFTQDVEDLPREAFGKADPMRSWEDGAPAARPASTPPPASMSAKLADMVSAAPTVEALKAIWADCGKALKAGHITLSERAELSRIKDARKAELAKGEPVEQVLAGNEMSAGWGGTEERCLVCNTAIHGDEPAAETTSPDGVVGRRHRDCLWAGDVE
jgi:hypothetical protein